MNNNPAGGCNTDVPPIDGNQRGQVGFTAPPPSLGMCQSSGQGTPSALTYAAQDRVCTPDSPAAVGCSGSQCTPNVASPYLFCISGAASSKCPAPFSHQHLVGNNPTLACSSCNCTAPTPTCSGTVKFFMDPNCKFGETDIPADGTCHDAQQVGPFQSYEYIGVDPPSSCQTTGTSTVQNLTLQNQQTICCLH
jgi:hypothetical protein